MSDEELVKRLRDAAFLAFDDGTNDYGTPVESADRIEALTAERDAWKEQHAAEALGLHVQMQRADALQAKLAKAMWLLTEAAVQLEEGKIKTRRNRAAIIWNLLDEMKDNDAP